MDRRSFLGGLTASLVIGCTPSGEPVAAEVADDLVVSVSEQSRVYAPDGSYVVIDRPQHQVVRMSGGGDELSRFGGLGTDVGQLNGPSQIVFAPNGDAWILDRGNRRLQRFDSQGRSVGIVPIESGSAFTVGGDGRLFVADASLQRVQVFHPDGSVVAEHALDAVPQSVAVDRDGRIAVVTLDGAVLSVGAQLTELVPVGSVGFPRGIAFHPDGRILVADGHANAIRAYAASGREAGIQRLYMTDGRTAQPRQILAGPRGVQVTVRPGEV